MTFCYERPKREQNHNFARLSETTSIPVPFIWDYRPQPPPPPPPGFELTVHWLAWL